MSVEISEDDITKLGNPSKPQGDAGREMLMRMNESHYDVTHWAVDFMKVGDNDTILDIGCGGGVTLNYLSGLCKNGSLYGVDYSDVSVELSIKANDSDIKSGKMKIVTASVEKLPFHDDSFDRIITVESFYFWPSPAENLAEVRRVLNVGGKFFLVADIYGKEGLSEKAVDNIKQYDLFNPTPDEFEDMFKKAGFKNVITHLKDGEDWICVEGSKSKS